ncbi:MAG: DUF1385 domain-containing protein [Candidatus Woesearchaeota archaeon]
MAKEIIGGQALIEGVLMKNKNKIAVAVRRPDRKITIKKETYSSKFYNLKLLKWPFIRGIFSLFDMLIVGMKALTFSANESLGEDEEKLSTKEIAITITSSMLLAIGLFVGLPFLLTSFIKNLNGVMFNVTDGVFRVGIVLTYMGSIRLMRDVRRMFEYHGAEHKTVNCYEAGEKLTVKNVKKHTTLNPRCGTSFIFYVLIISIFIFSLIPAQNLWIKFGSRILLLPLIAGVSYEILRFSSRHENNFFFKILTWPGLMMQKITTKEPNDKQIEVAIKAMKEVI